MGPCAVHTRVGVNPTPFVLVASKEFVPGECFNRRTHAGGVQGDAWEDWGQIYVEREMECGGQWGHGCAVDAMRRRR